MWFGYSEADGLVAIRPATDRAQAGDARTFLTEGALLRLEEGLRAQREQPDGTTELKRDNQRLDPANQRGLRLVVETEIAALSAQRPSIPPSSETPLQSPPPPEPAPAQCPEGAALSGQITPSAVSPSQENPRPPMQRAEQETPSPPTQEGRLFSEPDAASSRPSAQTLGQAEMRTADWLIVSTEIEAIRESPPLASSIDEPKIHAEEPAPSPSWRRRKVGLLLCALLLVVSAGALGVSLKTRTAGSSDAAPGDIETRGSVEAPRSPPPAGVQTVEPAESPRTASVAPDNDEPRQPITNGVKPSAATSLVPALSPAPPDEQPVEAQGPATPAASKGVAVVQTPVENEAKRARTQSRARVRQARRGTSLPRVLVLWLGHLMTGRR